jgi:ribosomal protein S12 methylthiotransferase
LFLKLLQSIFIRRIETVMKVGFISLGCSKNLVDTEHMMGILINEGHEIVNAPDRADAVVVNTCGFITDAKKEAISNILEMGMLKEQGKFRILVAAGCLAQRYPEELLQEIPELDAVVGVKDYLRLSDILKQCEGGERPVAVGEWPDEYSHHVKRLVSTPPGWAYLKIAEGCNNRCTYCAIPGIRGPLRSRPSGELVEEARALAADGVKELILVAQDSTAYGRDLAQGECLESLIEKLSKVDGVEWIRIMYAYPSRDPRELLNVLHKEKVVPYLDIPLQHGSDRILRLMGRRYDHQVINSLVNALKTSIPDLVLRTTLMTGFPGETEEDHFRNIELLRQLEFDWAGVFAYSKEYGTMASQLSPEVPAEVSLERRGQLMEIQQHITLKKNRQRVGSHAKVLIDREMTPGNYRGRTVFQAPEVDGSVLIRADHSLKTGDFVQVILTRTYGYDLLGEVQIGAT